MKITTISAILFILGLNLSFAVNADGHGDHSADAAKAMEKAGEVVKESVDDMKSEMVEVKDNVKEDMQELGDKAVTKMSDTVDGVEAGVKELVNEVVPKEQSLLTQFAEVLHIPNLLTVIQTMIFYNVPLELDNVGIADVDGDPTASSLWADSYSVDGNCYCFYVAGFSSEIAEATVMTPKGELSIREACDLIGPGPGAKGRPLYNDIQCGNGPGSDKIDEKTCPGRLDHAPESCGYQGPKWNFSGI